MDGGGLMNRLLRIISLPISDDSLNFVFLEEILTGRVCLVL